MFLYLRNGSRVWVNIIPEQMHLLVLVAQIKVLSINMVGLTDKREKIAFSFKDKVDIDETIKHLNF